MENNFPNDDENQDSSLSPKCGGKKQKLNDGSSQDSLKETASGSKDEKDENVDSGVSADKSESTSSEGHVDNPAVGPSNEIVNIGPSSSNIGAILLDIRQSRRPRNYRKRRTPDRDSDSDNSSIDSDDIALEEIHLQTSGDSVSDCSNSSPSIFIYFLNRSSSDSSSGSGLSLGIGNEENGSAPFAGETDSDDETWIWNHRHDHVKRDPPAVLFKTRPKHSYLILREIINRELGLTFPCGKTIQNDVMFEQKFYGSLHAVYRLEKLHSLSKHKGCVNSINFHPEGELLASGSDDTNVVVWDWAKKIPLQVTKSGHKSNVFQSKFLYLNAQSQINIATCARDGQVRLLSLPPAGSAGGGSETRRLATHARAAHKIHVWRTEPHLVVSAAEDALVMCADVRADKALKLIHVKSSSGNSIPLYSVAGHPLRRHELLLAGRDKFVRVYDSRQPAAPLALYRPAHFRESTDKDLAAKRRSMMHLTCAVYNHDGTEILGSYNDEDIYLFRTKEDVFDDDEIDGYTHRYSGHCNSATYKGVAFFGPKSEYIVSGSDCSYIYMWEKKSEAIVQWMEGDKKGVVNCIETHPRFPVMATSGLDKDVKIWIPKRLSDPTYEGMEKVVRDNAAPSPLFNDFLPSLYSTWHGGRLAARDPPGAALEFDGNVCAAF
ncbi:DDB1- and CUL4-associated factor 8 [Melitaea cinxia]|uniref:DDB1- and CUL4-associated factor 8 n=1 Tax=Melitaea cinxia TaxID=113334 RepID=UPI001E26FA3C|nr:DDB1- and CUL4-associated factor 8 [Melitaea cinxia]